MNEGSVMVDEGGDIPTPVEETNSQEEESSQEEVESTDKTQETETKSEGEEKTELTEKGTKLDPNPLSAAHQQLANANRRIQQMEQVLGNPELLKKYAAQSGLTLAEAKAEIKDEKKEIKDFTPDQFNTAEDVAKALNEIRSQTSSELKTLREENQRLKDGFGNIESTRRIEKVANTMQSDISAVQKKYSELNPKSSDYDPELEGSISDLYHELDYDKQSGGYRGNVSILKIADKIMSAANKAKSKGSQQAQTDVKVKRAGKVVTSSKSSESTSESKDAGTAISEKIAKALGNK